MNVGRENHNPPPLEMRGITKYFSGVRALDGADLYVERGEVLGLVGSNGAGKSTLMKVLSGVYGDYEGEILLDGAPVRLGNPLQALNNGIAVIYQEFSLVGTLSIAENIFLGKEPRRMAGGALFLDRKKLKEKTIELLEELNFGLNPDEPVRNLGVAEQQLVQIAKTMTEKPKILVMDEPTARLSRNERDNLFRIITRFKEQGVAIIYISHFLDEVFMVSSRVTVLRDGRVVGSARVEDLDHQQLVFMMLGRSIERGAGKSERKKALSQVPLLSVENFSMGNKFHDVSFKVRPGEILGLTGLVGAGRTEVARALFGAEKRASIRGNVYLGGEDFLPDSPRDAVERGAGLAPEDRKQQGLVLCRPIADNIAMAVNDRLTFQASRLWGWFLDHKKRGSLIDGMIERLNIKTSGAYLPVSTLSGGNQQKVVLAKWLATQARVLILDQPTAGIDIGTKDEIYRLLDELAAQSVGIVVISDDPEELSRVSDRVLVMRRGKITVELKDSITSDAILQAVTAEAVIAEAKS